MNNRFLWGGASAAFQCEGAYLEDGKSLSIMDVRKKLPNKSSTEVTSDHYHRYQEDIDLMAECKVTSYRFSISWARIIPDGSGEVNELGIQFYHDLIDYLRLKQIEPVVTLYHFDMPYKLQEKYNGWSNRQILQDFEHFCKTVFNAYKDKVTYWLTINEHNNCLYYPEFIGGVSNYENIEKWRFKVNHHLALGHALAVKWMREIIPNGKIGPALGWGASYPKRSTGKDMLASINHDLFTGFMIYDLNVYGRYPKIVWKYMVDHDLVPDIEAGDFDLLKQGTPDFLALNYYNSVTVEDHHLYKSNFEKEYNLEGKKGNISYPIYKPLFAECYNPHLEVNDWDWAIDPDGFHVTLRRIYERYELPMMITENGLGAYDALCGDEINDDYRINYLQSHLKAMDDAINDGVEMIGYHLWSFFDLLSSSNGFEKRYGLVYINRSELDLKDLKRIKKKSYFWFKDYIYKHPYR